MNLKRILQSQYVSVGDQAERLHERRSDKTATKTCAGLEVVVFPGVYGTSIDTELMIDTVDIDHAETFLEIGCGTGIVSIALAQRAKRGIGVDVNQAAVENSKANAQRLHVANVSFFESDVFQNVRGVFDVIVCNPPYGDHPVTDAIDRMFWDPNNTMKQRFFADVKTFLHPNGRIYFGWADFADIDVNLPFAFAAEQNLPVVRVEKRKSRNGKFNFYVFEFKNTI